MYNKRRENREKLCPLNVIICIQFWKLGFTFYFHFISLRSLFAFIYQHKYILHSYVDRWLRLCPANIWNSEKRENYIIRVVWQMWKWKEIIIKLFNHVIFIFGYFIIIFHFFFPPTKSFHAFAWLSVYVHVCSVCTYNTVQHSNSKRQKHTVTTMGYLHLMKVDLTILKVSYVPTIG